MPVTAESQPAVPPSNVLAADDLAEVIQAYSAVAERLQSSHEALQNEVARLHRELAVKNAQLERGKRLAALGEMAAGIAHEIRNPLAAIQLYVEMVGDDLHDVLNLPPQAAGCGAASLERRQSPGTSTVQLTTAADNTAKIAGAVRGLSAIVNDVLSFARQIEPQARPLATRDLVQRVIDEQRPALEAAGVAVAVDLAQPTLDADPDLLHQALINLVRNAADAMGERGGGTLTLRIADDQITVADTGPGLPDAVAERIFNPFFTTRSTGTGLGLAIVHRIVDAHGGSIAVHNDPARGGAVFVLELPNPEVGIRSPD
jgi:signal transduction histidine kinase